MSQLEKQLKNWTARGIISSDQASAILKHESEKPSSSWFLYGLLVLGVCVLLLGIGTLVAGSWNIIPKELKLAGAFSLLVVTTLFAYQAHLRKQPVFFDVAVLGFNLCVLGTITLIGHIYQSGGAIWLGLCIWSVVTIPSSLLTNFALVPFIWFGGVLWALSELLGSTSSFYRNYNGLFMLMPLIAALGGILSKLIRTSTGFTKALNTWFLVCLSAALLSAEVDNVFHISNVSSLMGPLLPGIILGAIVLFLVWTSKLFSQFQKWLVTSLIVIYLGSFFLRSGYLVSFSDQPSEFSFVHLNVYMSAVITFLELCLVGLFLASQKKRTAFNYILALLALRFFILCIQSFGGMSIAGLGLILSGLVLIGLAILWHKKKNEIAAWTEKWVG